MQPGGPAIFVRLAALDEASAQADVAAAAAMGAHGVVLTRASGAGTCSGSARGWRCRRRCCGLPEGSLRILVFATETPEAIFGLSSYRGASPRLAGLLWTASPLTRRCATARGGSPLRLARDLTLFAARAAGVPALDAPFPDVGDLDGLRAEAEAARADGFDGKAAIDPAQVAVINAVFR